MSGGHRGERIEEGHYWITLLELYVAEAILVEPEP